MNNPFKAMKNKYKIVIKGADFLQITDAEFENIDRAMDYARQLRELSSTSLDTQVSIDKIAKENECKS